MKKNFLILIFLLMLLLNTSTKNGTIIGLNIWLNNIVPILFPYILIINIIMLFEAFTTVSFFIYPFFSKIFKVNKNGCFCIIVGFLCGFPIGIKLINDMVSDKKLTPSEGNYLATFCNNISPSFYLNIVISGNFMQNSDYINNYYTPLLHIIFILLPYLASIICSFIYRFLHKVDIINLCEQSSKKQPNAPENISSCILNTFDSLFTIGGYIIIFSIISNILLTRINLPPIYNSILNTFIDITNSAILFKNQSARLLITILIPLCSFGGISALFQALSFIRHKELSKKVFITYRFINLVISFLFSNIIYFLIS